MPRISAKSSIKIIRSSVLFYDYRAQIVYIQISDTLMHLLKVHYIYQMIRAHQHNLRIIYYKVLFS